MFTLDQLVFKAAKKENLIVAVAAAEDREVLKAVQLAIDKQLASFLLFANERKIKDLMESEFQNLLASEKITISDVHSNEEAAMKSVQAVSSGQAHVLMKGNIQTSIILKAVLNDKYGLRTGSVLSHVAAFEIPGFQKLYFVTDAAMNIAPGLKEKIQIINNAVHTARACGIEQPVVAPLAAVETVNPAMPPTLDAAALTMMNERGQIKNCLINGPVALDNAVSIEAAQQKGIKGNAAGKADILLVPNIESGNILYKSLIYFARAKVGAIIQGAKAPIVLTSRADSAESKVYSLALAILSTNKYQ